MRAMLTVMVVAMVGCGGTSPKEAPPSATDSTAATYPPACAIDASAPERYTATLALNDVKGIDCFTGSWDGVFNFGFAHANWSMSLEVPRWLNANGSTIALDGNSVGLLYQGPDGSSCTNWTGTLRWSDAPAWRVELDATCVDGAVVRVAGTWSGNG